MTNTSANHADFLIITALEKEAQAVVKHFATYDIKRFESRNIRTYHCGVIPVDNSDRAYTVVVVLLPNMGELSAANATTDALNDWQPKHVLMIGIAGGIAQDDLDLGDVVVADQVIGYEYGKQFDDGLKPRDHVYPASALLLERVRNFWNEEWTRHITVARPANAARSQPKRFVGPIASGNKIIASKEFQQQLLMRWPKLIAIETEAEGVFSAVFDRPEIKHVIVIRGISDMADKAKNDVWQLYAADAAAAYAVAFLKSRPVEVDTARRNNEDRQDPSPPAPPPAMIPIGRGNEIKEIESFLAGELISQPGFLNICGMAGIGKTALAEYLQAIHGPHVKWISVPQEILHAAEREAGWLLVLGQLADKLEASLDLESILSAIKTKPSIVILDGIDNFVGEPGLNALLSKLRGDSKGKVIVTSQSGISLRYEHELRLYPLELPEARSLFLRTWGQAEILITNEQLTEINTICKLVDGHPLSINLLAGWAKKGRGQTLADIRIRLNRELEQPDDERLLGTSQFSDGKNRNTWYVIKLSINRLTADSQELLARCAIFPQEFDEDCLAAATILQPNLDVLIAKTELLDTQLLTVNTAGQYSLHSLVRAYARKHLDTDRRKQIEYSAGSVLARSGMFSRSKRNWLLGLELLYKSGEFEQVLAAVRSQSGNYESPSAVLAIELIQLRAGFAIAFAADKAGLVDLALDYTQIGLSALENTAASTAAVGLIVRLRVIQARNWVRRGDLVQAQSSVRTAFEVLEHATDDQQTVLKWELGQLYLIYGMWHHYNGENYQAAEYTLQALEIFDTLHDARQIYVARSNLATITEAQGQLHRSHSHTREALDILEQYAQIRPAGLETNSAPLIGDDVLLADLPSLIVNELANLTDVLIKLGRFQEAASTAERGLSLLQDTDFTEPHRALLINLGYLRVIQCRFAEGIQILHEAQAYSKKVNINLYSGQIPAYLGLAFLSQNILPEAQRWLETALTDTDDYCRAEAYRIDAQVQHALGNRNKAIGRLKQGVNLCLAAQFVYFENRLWLQAANLGLLAEVGGDRTKLNEVVVYFEEIGAVYYADQARNLLG